MLVGGSLAYAASKDGPSDPETLRLPIPSERRRYPSVRGYAAPLMSGSGTHGAIDVVLPVGTPIYSIGTGEVSRVVFDHKVAGTFIEIKHSRPGRSIDGSGVIEDQLYSRYLHLSSPTPHVSTVKVGDKVKAGDLIGLSGGKPGDYGAGNTTTPHLHLELWRGRPYSGGRTIDPANFINVICPEKTEKGDDGQLQCLPEASRTLGLMSVVGGTVLLSGIAAVVAIRVRRSQ